MDTRHREHMADESDAANKDWLMPSVEQQCADELVSECHQPGTIARGDWIDFRADHGSISAKDFIALCRQDGGTLWTDRCEAIYDDMIEGINAQ